jgi:hypothetical protein
VKYVFELHRSHTIQGKVYQTGGSTGELFSRLPAAFDSVPDATWTKRARSRQWDSDKGDIITRRPIQPIAKIRKRR